jgi:Zn-dependent protease with chaperone function
MRAPPALLGDAACGRHRQPAGVGLAGGFEAFALETRDSRDFEREAHRFAAERLRANRIATAPLAGRLTALDGEVRSAVDDRAKGFVSTHPQVAERIRALRKE